MIKFLSVTNPKFPFAENNSILCRVMIEGLDGERDFLATSDDVHEHGRILHQELLEGIYGEIEPYKESSQGVFQDAFKALLETKPIVTQNTVNSILKLPKDGITMTSVSNSRGAVGILVDAIKANPNLPVGTSLLSLKGIFRDAKKMGIYVFGHLTHEAHGNLSKIYEDLGVTFIGLSDGSFIAEFH